MSNTTIPQIGDTKKGFVFTERGWTATEPPKKKRTFLKVFLGLCAVGVVGIVALIAFLSSVADEVSKSIDSERDNDAPVAVAEGAAFTHDGYKVSRGWKVVPDGIGSMTIKGLKVHNVSHDDGDQDTPMFTFALWQGQTNLGEIEASGNAIAKGQTSKMDAFSLDDIKPGAKFTAITVEDMW